MEDETIKTAREIMDDEAQAAEEYAEPTQEEKQAAFDRAFAQMEQRQEDERELARLETRREYRQFVAGQVYPVLVSSAILLDAEHVALTADRAVRYANELIAALDRAETLDGASDTEQ